jgi:hypothetical protein
LRSIDPLAEGGSPALGGAVWYPCAQPADMSDLGKISLPGVNTAEVLADAGFMVAAINHAGDTSADLSRTDDLSIYVSRPNDIKRLIDFMLAVPAFAAGIDRDRIGL